MRIGILTSGGDCPGINATIRGVCKTAINHYGMEVVGIHSGFQGLLTKDVESFTDKSLSGLLNRLAFLRMVRPECSCRSGIGVGLGAVEIDLLRGLLRFDQHLLQTAQLLPGAFDHMEQIRIFLCDCLHAENPPF